MAAAEYLSLPWVDLSPVKYVIGGNTSVIPQLDDFARDVLKVVFNNSGLAVSILELIGRIANLTGLAVLPLLLFTERGAAIVVLAVPIFAIISGLAGLLSFIPGLENLRRKLGWAQCAFLGLLAIVFLTQLPTISIGLAVREAGATEEFGAMFQRADQALYRAKAAGRNQVVGPGSRGWPAEKGEAA